MLEKLYYSPEQPSGFGGKYKLYKDARKHGWTGTLKDVEKYLHSQPVYTLHYPSYKRFKRNRIMTYGIDYLWQGKCYCCNNNLLKVIFSFFFLFKIR